MRALAVKGLAVKGLAVRALRRLAIRLAGLFSKARQERELAEEFESHFQLHVEDNLRRGMSAQEARRDARLKFGSVDAAKESMPPNLNLASRRASCALMPRRRFSSTCS